MYLIYRILGFQTAFDPFSKVFLHGKMVDCSRLLLNYVVEQFTYGVT